MHHVEELNHFNMTEISLAEIQHQAVSRYLK